MTTSIYNTQYVIYIHTNIITGKSYIGKTTQGMEKRWNRHLSNSNRNKDNFKFYNSIRKHGTDCWTHEVLYYCLLEDDQYLYEVEEQLISDWNTYHNGYNSDKGGVGSKSGINSYWYNKKHTEKTKISMTNSRTGINNYKFTGYYCYHKNKNETTKLLGNIVGLSGFTISNWFKNLDKNITNKNYSHSKFLQSLGTRDEIVGKTFADIGFWFESI